MARGRSLCIGLLVCLLAIAGSIPAAQVQADAWTNPNEVIRKTVTTPAGERYFLVNGSSTVQLLDQNFRAVSEFQTVNGNGHKIAFASIRYDESLNTLVGLTAHDLYAINTVTGLATPVEVPSLAIAPREYEKIAMRQQSATERVNAVSEPMLVPVDQENPESVRAHQAYSRWLVSGTATPEEKALMEQYVFPRQEGSRRSMDEIGGPDGYGYIYFDSNEGAPFSWIELCGDPLANNGPVGDDFTTMISWANPFMFYGTAYTSAFISTNGLISFDEGNPSFTNKCPFADGEPLFGFPTIAPYWDDLRTDFGAGCGVGEVGLRWRDFGDMVVIEWAHVAQFGDATADLTFEAILYPATGAIVFQYNNLSLPLLQNSGSVGIDGDGDGNGLEYGVCNSTTFPNGTDDLAIHFVYAPLPPPLLCDCPVLNGNLIISDPLNIEILDLQGASYCDAGGQIVHTLTVPGGAGLVEDVNVIVNLFHTFYPDLVLDIEHNGTRVLLTSQGAAGVNCGARTWIFDDSGVPWYSDSDCGYEGCVQPGALPEHGCATTTDLNAFNGQDASGDWTFRLVDAVGLDVGTLFDWGLCLTTTHVEPGFVGAEFEFPVFGCVDDQLAPLLFNLPVTMTNHGGSPCDNVEFSMGGGAGPGGGFSVDPANHNFGTLASGESATFDFSISITPSGTGGNIFTSALVSSANCGSYFIDFITVPTPACGEPGNCGCMDVTFVIDVTGSMGFAIDNVKNELPNIISDAQAASGGDVRFSLISFTDDVFPLVSHTFDYDLITSQINGLFASGGNGEPEASDEALRHALLGFNECDQDDAVVVDPWREGCDKIAVLVTDARPGGCDDFYNPGEDDVNAHSRALDALNIGAKIAAVYVPVWPDFAPEIVPIMIDYATTSNGSYRMVNADGSGTGAAIAEIVRECGEAGFGDDCLPEGPDCNGGQPLFYSTTTGLIADATLQVTADGHLVLNWTPVNGTEWYQVYTAGELDEESNWSSLGMSYDPSFVLPEETLENSNPDAPTYFYVKTKVAAQNLIASDIACWPIDEGSGETVEDFAQDNDGTIHGAEWITGPSGHYGLHFGYGDYVRIENDCEFYGQPLQIQACCQIEQYPTVQGGAYYILSCHRYTTWFEGFGLRIDINGRLLSQVWNQNTGSWQTLWAPSNRQVPLGEPFLVTAVINGRDSMLLLNGEVVATGRQDYVSITNGFSMALGAHHYNDEGGERYQYHMHGDIHWAKVSQIDED